MSVHWTHESRAFVGKGVELPRDSTPETPQRHPREAGRVAGWPVAESTGAGHSHQQLGGLLLEPPASCVCPQCPELVRTEEACICRASKQHRAAPYGEAAADPQHFGGSTTLAQPAAREAPRP